LYELAQYKKSETNPLLIQQHFAEIRSVTSEYSTIYTDGSKDGDRVASTAETSFRYWFTLIFSAKGFRKLCDMTHGHSLRIDVGKEK
jgi:hypothetical protein